ALTIGQCAAGINDESSVVGPITHVGRADDVKQTGTLIQSAVPTERLARRIGECAAVREINQRRRSALIDGGAGKGSDSTERRAARQDKITGAKKPTADGGAVEDERLTRGDC